MNLTGKHCVVTGGAGAIGSNLVRRLLDSGCSKVYVVDDLSSGFRWLLPDTERVVMLKRDVSQPFMQSIPFGAAAFFHLAAHFANQNSVEQPFADLRTNGQGTLQALEAAVQNRSQRFVFASAGCAAGHRDTPYQIHKALGEEYCRYFADRVPTVICRFHNSYGPGEVPGTYRNVIPRWVWAAMHEQQVTIFGGGSDVRDFVYVDDLVNFLVTTAMPTIQKRAAEYEIGTGEGTRISDLAEMVYDVVGFKGDIWYEDRRRWDHPGRWSEVPIPTTVTLRQGIERTYEWMKKNHRAIEESIR